MFLFKMFMYGNDSRCDLVKCMQRNCRNLSLGLATKARGCKVAGQKEIQ